MQEYPARHGVIRLSPAQRRQTLLHGLDLTLNGESEAFGTRQRLPDLIHVIVQPVGGGERIVVRGTCHELAVSPYFVQIFADISTEWPLADPEIYYSSLPKKEHALGQLRLRTNLQAFESELKDFTDAYQDKYVREVVVRERREHLLKPGQAIDRRRRPIDWNKRRSWDVKVQLRMGDGPGHGIYELALDVEASRIPDKYPLQLTITLEGFQYKEVEPFVSAFLARCRGLWRAAPEAPNVPVASTEAPLQLVAHGDQVVPATPGVPENPAAPSEPPVAVPVPAEGKPKTHDIPPWERIPDNEWHRQALRLWWEGHTVPEIGRIIHKAPKTIPNKLGDLRKMYGEEIVLYRKAPAVKKKDKV